MNARLPMDAQFREAGEVSEPVATDVYIAPEGPAFWGDEEDYDEDE